MPTIDERVVAMSFENTTFETKVSTTMATLTKLDTAIKNIGQVNGLQNIETSANKVTLQGPMSALDKLKAKLSGAGSGAAQGLGEIDAAGNKVTLAGPTKAIDKLSGKLGHLSAGDSFADMEKASDNVTFSGLTKAIDSISGHFSVVQGAISVALGNIVSKAVEAGSEIIKSFTLDPIKDGFKGYEEQINATQVVMSNLGLKGSKGLALVTNKLGELQKYANQTVYNFSQMAQNVGTFTAAGVGLNESTAAIKGIANASALAGGDASRASGAMYQLSQALSAGKFGLQDYQSVVTAGFGGKAFQTALAQSAVAVGTLSKNAVKFVGPMKELRINGESFHDAMSVKPGEKPIFTSEVLTKALGSFTGDLSAAQLEAQGYTKSAAIALAAQGKAAQNAASQIKTMTQLSDALKEEVGAAFSGVFKALFGDFFQARTLFTGLHTVIENSLTTPIIDFTKKLNDANVLGFRKNLLAGFGDIAKNVKAWVLPITQAFKEIFPPATAKDLADFAEKFAAFGKSLSTSDTFAEHIQSTFAGLFAVLHIGLAIAKGVVGVLLNLFGVAGKGAGGILGITASIGDFLVALDDTITKGGLLTGIFSALTAVLKAPITLIIALGKAIANLFSGNTKDAGQGLGDALDGVNKKLGPMKNVVDIVTNAWDKMVSVLGKVKDALEPWFDKVGDKFKDIGGVIENAFKGLDYNKIMQGLQVGFIGGIFVTLKKALGGGLPSVFGDAFKGVNEVMEGLTKNLEAMEQGVKAGTLVAIAGAILILASGVVILAKIDGKALAKSMSAISVGLGELVGALALLGAVTKGTGGLSLATTAAGMLLMAGAVLVLAGAVKIFSTMDWEGIGKGLAGVIGSITALAIGMKLMGGGAKLALQAAGLILIGVALNVIAAAMAQFGSMDMTSIAKGVFAIVLALAGIALGVESMPPQLPLIAGGLILMGIALASLGGAIKALGDMDFLTMLKGLGAMIAAIVGIGLAISLVPPTIALSAAGLLIVGQAMLVTAAAIAVLGKMSVGGLVKGIVGLAGALIVLAGGLTLMIVSAPGAVALLAAAAALAVLVPVLGLLGAMDWSTIFKGLAAIALVMVTIGVAGLVAAPALAALGVALIPLGLGFILVATAAKMFADALSTLGSEGQKGVAVMVAALTGFIALLPNIIISFIKGLLSIVDQVATLAPKIVVALGVIIDTIIAFVIEAAPKLAVAIGVLVSAILKVLVDNAPNIIQAGVTLLMDLLDGISQNIGTITDKVSEIIEKFLGALSDNSKQLVNAGVKTLEAFLNGISSHFGDLSTTVDNMISKFGTAVANHEARMVTIAGNMMLAFVGGIANYVPKLISQGATIILNFLAGLGKDATKIVDKGADLIILFIQGITSQMNKIANQGADAIITFLNNMADTIRTKGPELRAAGFNVAGALIDGMWQGIDQLGQKIVDKLGLLVKLLPSAVKKILGIKSPSTVFAEIGANTMLGFSKGIEDNSKSVVDSSTGIGNSVIDAFREVLGIHSPSDVMKDIGRQVNEGFAQGLSGSADDVLSAFSSLNDKLVDSIDDTKSDISDAHKKIEDLEEQHAEKLNDIAKIRAEKKPDKDALAQAYKDAQDLEKQIMDETTAVSKDEDALSTYRDTRALLTDGMKDEENQLVALKGQYDSVTKQLDAANDALNSAIQARDQAKTDLTSKFDTTPTIDDDSKTKVSDYTAALTQQIAATKQYTATLAKLRAAGLDDQTYQKLLDEGLAGQDFASQLLIGGKGAISKVNDLDAQLLSASQSLAQNAADQLYQAGVNAAQGLVDGLTAQKATLEQQMSDLATAMVNAIKQQLGIQSPSRVLMGVGAFVGQGFIAGLKGTSQAVASAAASVGDDAASALTDSIAHISDAISDKIDPDLTITPVLDLTQVQKDAQKLSDLTNVTPITAAASYGQANAASQEVSATQQAAADAAASAIPTVNFEQNNYSPEALSAVDIYRQTRNQLGQVKNALGIAS